jgi:hypothetical protein
VVLVPGASAECLTKDREALLALYDFPAEHWDHLRTTNLIESVFATVRHRTVRTKGSLSPTTARLMVFKLLCATIKDLAPTQRYRSTTPPDRFVTQNPAWRNSTCTRSIAAGRASIGIRHKVLTADIAMA